MREFLRYTDGRPWPELFGGSRWYRLSQILFEGGNRGVDDLRVIQQPSSNGNAPLRFLDPEGAELLRYLDQSPATIRFLERLGKTPKGRRFADRAGLISRLGTFLRSPEEQHLNKAGMVTNRQSFEEGLWWRLAYHGFRELGDGVAWRLRFDRRTGNVFITCSDQGQDVLEVRVPRSQLEAVLEFLDSIHRGDDAQPPPPRPLSASALFRAGPSTRVPEEDRNSIEWLVAYGEDLLLEQERARFRYGDLVLVEELRALVELDDDAARWSSTDPPELNVEAARVELFETIEPNGCEDLSFLEDPVADLGIFTEFDYMELEAGDEDAEGMELGIRYGFGKEEVSIGDLLRAKKAGLPFLQTDSGWIDLNSPSLRGLGSLLRRKELAESLEEEGGERRVRLSSAELLRLRASSAKPIRVEGAPDRSALLHRFLDLKPAAPLVMPKGLESELRSYQQLGLEWLKFLYDNRLAGLLCDDMGLGKTHQAMALMVLIREQMKVDAPFLVVCPRTVISHWRNKVRDHAPVLRPVQYHGPQRDLDATLQEGDLVLTSYGVLRNDVERLGKVEWGLVVFDEVQQIKNRATQGYQAAAALRSRMKLGLTGTPIENSLSELKALFDLILPGYLGSEDDFRDRYGSNADAEAGSWHLTSLRRLTAPFVLRRVKKAVLDELPEKIEDVRTCSLSDEQLRLYRQTIATKGVALLQKLRTKAEPLPYIHIFALLNMLKQICDHPALALGQVPRYQEYDSGKWDLFCELLTESLDSGQKVVVFTQYLGMIAMMRAYLEQLGVPSVSLTGSSRNRGAIVDRFNNDEDCRVFLGSLKAGGTGIDLVGGSVVIHYDRWWNAAREDQATDRLYRIGQKRVVQVFKLVTEHTLEERIAMIIERKRRLMSSVVQEDDPRLNKIFSREELIELLSDPDE